MANASASHVQQRDLWGGACQCLVPKRLIDVSDIRPVPDHQEVFADTEADQALILEIVEHDGAVADHDSGRHYFEDSAAGNEASSASIQDVTTLGTLQAPGVPEESYKCLVRGRQAVRRGRGDATDTSVLLAVVRMPHVRSDLLLTLSTPVASAAALEESEGILAQALATFRVNDWGLFG